MRVIPTCYFTRFLLTLKYLIKAKSLTPPAALYSEVWSHLSLAIQLVSKKKDVHHSRLKKEKSNYLCPVMRLEPERIYTKRRKWDIGKKIKTCCEPSKSLSRPHSKFVQIMLFPRLRWSQDLKRNILNLESIEQTKWGVAEKKMYIYHTSFFGSKEAPRWKGWPQWKQGRFCHRICEVATDEPSAR